MFKCAPYVCLVPVCVCPLCACSFPYTCAVLLPTNLIHGPSRFMIASRADTHIQVVSVCTYKHRQLRWYTRNSLLIKWVGVQNLPQVRSMITNTFPSSPYQCLQNRDFAFCERGAFPRTVHGWHKPINFVVFCSRMCHGQSEHHAYLLIFFSVIEIELPCE